MKEHKMKKSIVFIILLLAISLFAQQEQTGLLKIKNTNVGGYIGLSGKAASIDDRTTGLGELKIAAVLNSKWAIGLTGSGLAHDQELSELVDDGTYHLYASYGGMFVERYFALCKECKFSIGLMTGAGNVYYQYDQDYRKEKVWTEEIIDMTTFGVQELWIEYQHHLVNNFWLGVMASYRHTSPLKLIATDDDLLKGANFGITLKYGVF